jgi:YD repeat-containing protein
VAAHFWDQHGRYEVDLILERPDGKVLAVEVKLVSESDPDGYLTTLSYNASGQLATVTDPAGRQFSFSYGPNGLVSKLTDPVGRSVSYGYDTSGDLTSVTDVGGGVTNYGYNSAHLLLTMENANGGTTTNTYNSAGQVTEQVDPMGRATQFSYSGNSLSPSGGSTLITGPGGNLTLEGYVSGALIYIVKGADTPAAATTSYAVDPDSLSATQVSDPDGHTTSYTYDADGDVLAKTDGVGNTWTYTYNSFGEPLTSQTPDQVAAGVETTNTYDADGDLLSTSTPLPGGGAATTTYHYGTGCSTSGANGCYTGDVQSVTDANGKTTSYTYDAYGDKTSSTDPLGNTTTYTYNVLGERASMVSPRVNGGGGLTPGDLYDIAGSSSGQAGNSGYGGPATSALLPGPSDVAVDAAGDVYFSTYDNQVDEVAGTTHTQWGMDMTAGDVYIVAGSQAGYSGDSGDGGPATSARLYDPLGVAVDGQGDLYIADTANHRVQEVAAYNHTQWGTAMTTGDIYTVAGSATASSGSSGGGGPATSALLSWPDGITVDPAGGPLHSGLEQRVGRGGSRGHAHPVGHPHGSWRHLHRGRERPGPLGPVLGTRRPRHERGDDEPRRRRRGPHRGPLYRRHGQQ